MEKVYNTKLTAEQKADLKEYKQSAKNAGGVVVFIHDTTIAMLPDDEYDNWYIGKAVASKREQKLRAKVGMFYALERAYKMNRIVSNKVYNQILDAAKYYACATVCYYEENDKAFDSVRYL